MNIALVGVKNSDGNRVWACLHGTPTQEGEHRVQYFNWGRQLNVDKTAVAILSTDHHTYTHGGVAYREMVDRVLSGHTCY